MDFTCFIAHIGIGTGNGEDKAVDAIKKAMESPLLETTVTGASDIIINFSGDVGIQEVYEAVSYLTEVAGDEALAVRCALFPPGEDAHPGAPLDKSRRHEIGDGLARGHAADAAFCSNCYLSAERLAWLHARDSLHQEIRYPRTRRNPFFPLSRHYGRDNIIFPPSLSTGNYTCIEDVPGKQGQT